MTAVAVYGLVVIWVLVALALALVVGMSIGEADRRELPAKPCCPHDPKNVGAEPVRGEFRAIVVPMPARGEQLDIRA